MTKIFLIEYNDGNALEIVAGDIMEAIDIFRGTETGKDAEIERVQKRREEGGGLSAMYAERDGTYSLIQPPIKDEEEPDWASEPRNVTNL